MEVGAVVEADAVLQEAFPSLQQAWSGAVPELLLDGALHPLHLAVEVGASGPDTGMPDAQAAQEMGEIASTTDTITWNSAAVITRGP